MVAAVVVAVATKTTYARSSSVNSRLVRVAVPALQWATVAMGLLVLLDPASRTPAVRVAANVLVVVCGCAVFWRTWHSGLGTMTLGQIWRRTRAEPNAASMGGGALDLLSGFMAIIALVLTS